MNKGYKSIDFNDSQDMLLIVKVIQKLKLNGYTTLSKFLRDSIDFVSDEEQEYFDSLNLKDIKSSDFEELTYDDLS